MVKGGYKYSLKHAMKSQIKLLLAKLISKFVLHVFNKTVIRVVLLATYPFLYYLFTVILVSVYEI